MVDTVGRFTEYGEDALQRLTAGSTRPTGPLLVASPTHRWGILAAMELHASLYGTMVSYEDLSRSYGLPSGVDLPPHQDHAIVQEFYDKWSVNLQPSHKDACAVLAWAACETAPPCQLLLRQPDKWVTDKKGNSVLRRPFLPAFFCQHPLMATLDMHGELCTWRLFTLRGIPGVPTPLRALPMERC